MNYKLAASILVVCIGLVLVLAGTTMTIPDRALPNLVSFGEHESTGEGSPQYVGGDAYNLIMESSIRGGEIAGARAARAIYMSSGWLIIAIGIIGLGSSLSGGLKKKEENHSATSDSVASEDSSVAVDLAAPEDSPVAVDPAEPEDSLITVEPVESE